MKMKTSAVHMKYIHRLKKIEIAIWDLLPTCFHAGFLFGLFFDPEDRGDIFLRNVSSDYTTLYPRR
jgi:hypothetical protein